MNLSEYIFSDFDGTISKFDVIHSFITSFSKGDWSICENAWIRGEISTEECLKTQFSMIEVKKKVFNDFLNSIEIDPYFEEFCKLADAENKKVIILSDGYDVFIETALKKYNIDIPVFANKLFVGEKNGFITLDMEYPYQSKECKIASGCCKCACAMKFSNNFTYIGDGLSDRCIAKKSSLLYAKSALREYCKSENVPYIPYKTFKDVIEKACTEVINAANSERGINRS